MYLGHAPPSLQRLSEAGAKFYTLYQAAVKLQSTLHIHVLMHHCYKSKMLLDAPQILSHPFIMP